MVEDKLAAPRADLASRDGVLVAFSGGVDSSVVAAVAHDALGDRAVACTARSETLPAAELEDARRVAGEIGIRHDVVGFSELDSEACVQNDERRCYHCRSMRLGAMFARAAREHVETVGFDHVTLDPAGYQSGSVSPDETPDPLDAEYPGGSDAR